jgi:hypothetical protein
MGRLLRRLSALLLLTVFVGGGFGLSDLDALLYHSGHRAPAELPHYDQPGGCGAHAERCVLALAASLRQLAGGLSHLDSAADGQDLLVPVAPVVVPRSIDRSNLQPTRAPPIQAS